MALQLQKLAITNEVFFMQDNRVKSLFVTKISVTQKLKHGALEVEEDIAVYGSESFNNPQHNYPITPTEFFTTKEELLKTL